MKFRRMNETEFAAFRDWSVEDQAKELVIADNITKEEALKESAEEFMEMLPQGTHTPHNYLNIIQTEEDGDIGVIWYLRHKYQPESALIGEFIIKEEYRRQGYGARTLEQVFADAANLGYKSLILNVFRHNEPARKLYAKMGFHTIEEFEGNLILEKSLLH